MLSSAMHLSSFTHRGLILSLLKPHEGSSKVWQKSQPRPRLPSDRCTPVAGFGTEMCSNPSFNTSNKRVFNVTMAFVLLSYTFMCFFVSLKCCEGSSLMRLDVRFTHPKTDPVWKFHPQITMQMHHNPLSLCLINVSHSSVTRCFIKRPQWVYLVLLKPLITVLFHPAIK